MIKVYLDNGDIIECQKNSFNLHNVLSKMILTTKKGWFSLKKTTIQRLFLIRIKYYE